MENISNFMVKKIKKKSKWIDEVPCSGYQTMIWNDGVMATVFNFPWLYYQTWSL